MRVKSAGDPRNIFQSSQRVKSSAESSIFIPFTGNEVYGVTGDYSKVSCCGSDSLPKGFFLLFIAKTSKVLHLVNGQIELMWHRSDQSIYVPPFICIEKNEKKNTFLSGIPNQM